MISNVDEEEKLVHQIYGAGQRREVLMLTEDEKLNLQLVGAGHRKRNKYVWRMLL